MVEQDRLFHNTTLVMAGILLGNTVGFVREAVIAYLYGASRAGDIYAVAYTLPEFVFLALSMALAAVLIPALMKRRVEGGDAEVWALWGGFTAWLAGLLVLFAALGIVLAPIYAPWLAPGFDAESLATMTDMLRIMLLATLFMGLAPAVTAVLHVHGRFALPSLATAALNLGFIVVALALSERGVISLGWAVVVGSLAGLLVQLPTLRRLLRNRQVLRSHIPVRPLLGAVALMLVGYSAHHIIFFIDKAMASNLEAGSVISLNFASRTVFVLGAMLGLGASTALFPRLSQQGASHADGLMAGTLRATLRWMALVGLPLTALLMLLREPLITFLFERGAFDKAAVERTAMLVLWLAPGMLVDALGQPLWRTVFVFHTGRLVTVVNAAKTLLRVFLNYMLIPLMAVNGLALASTIGYMLQLVLLAWIVQRDLNSRAFLPRPRFWLEIGSATLAGLTLAWAATAIPPVSTAAGTWGAALQLALAGSIGILSYLVVARLLEVNELVELQTRWRGMRGAN